MIFKRVNQCPKLQSINQSQVEQILQLLVETTFIAIVSVVPLLYFDVFTFVFNQTKFKLVEKEKEPLFIRKIFENSTRNIEQFVQELLNQDILGSYYFILVLSYVFNLQFKPFFVEPFLIQTI